MCIIVPLGQYVYFKGVSGMCITSPMQAQQLQQKSTAFPQVQVAEDTKIDWLVELDIDL